MSLPARATAGALAAVLLAGVAYLGSQWATGGFDEHHVVDVTLGEVGQGVVAGSDVKIRGVIVGEVRDISLDRDLDAVAELELDQPYRVPRRAEFAVTAKTLLGERQIEIRYDGPWDRGPFLADGAHVDDPARVAEVQDVLAELGGLLDAVDPADLATLVSDGLGAIDGRGPAIARSVEDGAAAADVLSRSLDDQTAALADLSLVAEELGERGAAFNRMGEELIAGLPTISANEAGTQRLLDQLRRAAPVLDTTLRVDRDSIDRLLRSGDSVTRLLFAYRPEVGEVINGLADYTEKWGTGFKSPATTGTAARFIAVVDLGLQQVCQAPALGSLLPACSGGAATAQPSADGGPSGGAPGGASAPPSAATQAAGAGGRSVAVPVAQVGVPSAVVGTRGDPARRDVTAPARRALAAGDAGGGP